MRRRAPSGRVATGALLGLAALAALGATLSGAALGERVQRGNLIVSLDGQLSPLKLPRDRAVPVSVRLKGGLQTNDGELLPRVTRIELGLPGKGVLSTRGLPTCSQRRLRDTTSEQALANCGSALVGNGSLAADVLLPNQKPFEIVAELLAFNGRVGGRRAVIVHAYARKPPTVVVLPFIVRQRDGRLGTALVADLPPALGPWPHFARFQLTLSRRYNYGGRERSFISASCPVGRRSTAGFFSLARATFTLAGGRQISTDIARSCRAR